ncbi:hypothetical protein GQ457_06G019270 [Hibiscus cannabinus]
MSQNSIEALESNFFWESRQENRGFGKKIEYWDELDDTERLNWSTPGEFAFEELWEALKFRESLWRQKLLVKWLQDGDSNIAYFHRITKVRAKRARLAGLNTVDGWVTDPNKVKKRVFEFFRKHFNALNRGWKAKLSVMFKQLHQDLAGSLERPFSEAEIKEAIWSCEESKAPGPDRFNLGFFKKCWDTIKGDLLLMMEEFFHHGRLPNSANSIQISV